MNKLALQLALCGGILMSLSLKSKGMEQVVLLHLHADQNNISLAAENTGTDEICLPLDPIAWTLNIRRGDKDVWRSIGPKGEMTRSIAQKCLKAAEKSKIFSLSLDVDQKKSPASVRLGDVFEIAGETGRFEYRWELKTLPKSWRLKSSSSPTYFHAYATTELLKELEAGKPIGHFFSQRDLSAVNALKRILKNRDTDSQIKMQAVYALQALPTSESVLALVQLLRADPEVNLAIAARRALANMPMADLQTEILSLEGIAKDEESDDALMETLIRALVNSTPSSVSLKILQERSASKRWKDVQLQALRGRLQLGDITALNPFVEKIKKMDNSKLQDFLTDLYNEKKGRLLALAVASLIDDKRQGPYLGQGHGHDLPELSTHVTIGDQAVFTAIALMSNVPEASPIDGPNALRKFTSSEKAAVKAWLNQVQN